MLVLFTGTLFVLALGTFALLFALRLRILQSAAANPSPVILPGRYRPMMRLLSDDDFRFRFSQSTLKEDLAGPAPAVISRLSALSDPRLRRSLLAGLPPRMVQSGIDRPDLAHALSETVSVSQ